jgi:DNA polymerase-3 subunit delta'
VVNAAADLLPWLREPLRQAMGRHVPALLVHGESGVGQFEFAVSLAAALLCEGADEAARPCGHCASCQLLPTRAHPDLRVLIPQALSVALGWSEEAVDDDGTRARGAKPSREIRVEAVRSAIEWAQQTPSRTRGKVMLVNPAQAMNAVTANALLKTLEEPPGTLRIVLCTSDPDLLMPTVRSRCQRLRLATPPRAEALAWLQEQGIGDADVLLSAAGGRPLDALALASDGLDAARWAALPRRVARGDPDTFAGLPVPRIVESLQKLCHDAMARAAGGQPRFFDAATLPPPGPMAPLAAWSKSLVRLARHDEHPWQAALLADALVMEAQAALVSKPAGRG